jgi:hypothetical protein
MGEQSRESGRTIAHRFAAFQTPATAVTGSPPHGTLASRPTREEFSSVTQSDDAAAALRRVLKRILDGRFGMIPDVIQHACDAVSAGDPLETLVVEAALVKDMSIFQERLLEA